MSGVALEMSSGATKEQIAVLERIAANGGEAIRSGAYFIAGGWNVCDRAMMERMVRKGLIRIEAVGESVFAIPS